MQSVSPARPNYEARVGLFALIAIILLLWGWSWLKSFSLFHPPQRFIVQFHDVAGLNRNAPVNVNGVRVGTVEKLGLKGKGQVQAQLKINSEDVMIPQGSTVTIQTLGLVGAKYVEITLPEIEPGQAAPPPLEPNSIVIGQDPIRVELVVNKIATNLSQIDIARARARLSQNVERMARAADSISETSNKFREAAASTRTAAASANVFFSKGTSSFSRVSALADDWRVTSQKVNKILNNPALSRDLKETAEKARQTADSIQVAVHELNSAIADKNVRADLIDMLNRVDQSTQNIYKSVQVIHKVADDQGLRTDVKQILADAKEAMGKVDDLVSQPTFGADLKVTINQVKTAAGRVDLAARQLNQILNKKRPLLHMIFGRPGYIKDAASDGKPQTGASTDLQ